MEFKQLQSRIDEDRLVPKTNQPRDYYAPEIGINPISVTISQRSRLKVYALRTL